ncbi:uncharacterized protein LOC131604258 isoform X2 [Vicia villosa]|uniref:uncharacterized protein LOC131604258 isoform X2 n=1 Tax=Vicia villosa TaxID=3911 RepID=UPI00273B8B22|nr:uncharacterized protein LOC131604258 isoform X2 [Vicia villosa]
MLAIRVPYPFQWGAPTFDAGEAFAMMMASFVALVECLLELSLPYIGMQVQHHYRLLFLVEVSVGRELAFCYQDCLEQLPDRPCLCKNEIILFVLFTKSKQTLVEMKVIYFVFYTEKMQVF